MSGHCLTADQNKHPDGAHRRCSMPRCPCACHFEHAEQYECDGCGGVLVETDWKNPDPEDVDEDGNLEPVYTHLAQDGTATGQECS
jgi:hypothetical protein